jgi:predicted secreted hydrolase
LRFVAACSLLIFAGSLHADDWRSVVEPRAWSFPLDHAAHTDFRIEWWYYTGNLQTADGRPFGFELTFFRTGVDFKPANPSLWAVRDLYPAHFALSDIGQQKFHHFDRLSRAGPGWSGARTDRMEVWNGPWSARLDGKTHLLHAAADADENSLAIDLKLTPKKEPVLHGDRGLSQKGPTRGNASYYYSLTRMETTGTIRLGGKTMPVTGLSWMDHEFSSSFLEPGQSGWDWICLQLEDGRELMVYRMRRTDGATDRESAATLVAADGSTEHLTSSDFQLVPGKVWVSPKTAARYPVAWQIKIPKQGIDLALVTPLDDQELDTRGSTGIAYWEGAVKVQGTQAGKKLSGKGYLEMTGYAGKMK